MEAESAARRPTLYKPGRVEGRREIVVRPNYVMVYRVREDSVEGCACCTWRSNGLDAQLLLAVPMSLADADAAFCLDDLAAGRVPDLEQALQGLLSLDPLILGATREQALMDAPATLELGRHGRNRRLLHVRPHPRY